jgi:formiminoglutamase
MMKDINTQSQKRASEALGCLFGTKAKKKFVFLKSSSDEGVIRNGGRNGARFAPQSLLSTFKKLNRLDSHSDICFEELEVSDSDLEKKDFPSSQLAESQKIATHLSATHPSWLCHLGGGHDHIYPLLTALGKTHKKILVLNIDAHADTRTDDAASSGTPFRQFAEEFEGTFHLVQIGLHPFANSISTLSPLKKGEMKIIWKKDVSELKKSLEALKLLVDKDTLVIFSLDADALKGEQVPGVSAVNGDGLSLDDLEKIWEFYRALVPHHPIIGIYELNPVYDSLSSLSMRSLSGFLYKTLN